MQQGYNLLQRRGSNGRRDYFLGVLTVCLLLLLWQVGIVSKFFGNGSGGSGSTTDGGQSSGLARSKYDPNDIQSMDQTDKNLHYYIRSHHIFLPSVLEYSFEKGKALSYLDPPVDEVVYPLFKNKTEGFFVEVGGYDGVQSHTLILERDQKWNGLLIECHPDLIPRLKSVNRKAYFADVCLSPTTHPVKTKMRSTNTYDASSSLGSGDLFPPGVLNFTEFEVQTVPLFSILASIDIFEVDLFILDIQSLELEVLKHFPFELVLVKVWVVETYFFSTDQKDWLIKYMDSKGYPAERTKKIRKENTDYDMIFIHKSFPK